MSNYLDGYEKDVCTHCDKKRTKEGYDGCLGTLDESIVMNACCGHGEDNTAYIQFWNKERVSGVTAIKIQRSLTNEQANQNNSSNDTRCTID